MLRMVKTQTTIVTPQVHGLYYVSLLGALSLLWKFSGKNVCSFYGFDALSKFRSVLDEQAIEIYSPPDSSQGHFEPRSATIPVVICLFEQ